MNRLEPDDRLGMRCGVSNRERNLAPQSRHTHVDDRKHRGQMSVSSPLDLTVRKPDFSNHLLHTGHRPNRSWKHRSQTRTGSSYSGS